VLSQLTELYRDGKLIARAIEQTAAQRESEQAGLTERRAALTKEIQQAERALERYQRAFESGRLGAERFAARVSALDGRLEALPEQDHQLAQDIATEAPTARETADLAAVAAHLDQIIATGDPKQAKALLRLLIAELRVNSPSEILPTYRVIDPSVCAPTSSVEPTGIEPVTSCLQSAGKLAPNGTKTPTGAGSDPM
jgi:chromosome segregation ATPase